MKTMKNFKLLFAAVALLGFAACSSSDDASENNGEFHYNPEKQEAKTKISTGKLVKLNSEALGSWDEGYVTENGIYLRKKNDAVALEVRGEKTRATADTPLNAETLYFTNADASVQASVLVNKDDLRPLQLILKEGTLNFSFLSDEVLELVFKSGTSMTYIDQIPYDKTALDAALQAANYENDLQKALFYFAKVTDINKLTSYPTVVASVRYFCEVINFTYDADVTVTAEEAGIEVTEKGEIAAVTKAETFEEQVIAKVYTTLSVWTGKASFKVGGSSCTLSGTVFCADPSFSEVGSVGIVCDADPNKLYVGQAEFEGKAQLKDGQNFDVDFRGFKAETTYYYRAFYKFNDNVNPDDLAITIDANQRGKDGVCYDTTTKQFTTDENKLYVDVVMCMDISGSMSDEINMVKQNAIDFYNLFNDKCVAANIKLLGLTTQVVTFSDINVDREQALNESDIYDLKDANQKAAFESFVNNIYLAGGGDGPESGLEALAAAFHRESWGVNDGYHRQVIILWTDAPYKTINEGIYQKLVVDEKGDPVLDEFQNYVYEPMYTAYSYDEVYAMWNKMPTGRRMILFAPASTWGESNAGSWSNMDEWKNVYREENSYESFNDFGKSLDYIITELTGKEKDSDSEGGKVKASRMNLPYPRN